MLYDRPLVDASIVKYQGQFWMFASDQVCFLWRGFAHTFLWTQQWLQTMCACLPYSHTGQDGTALWPA